MAEVLIDSYDETNYSSVSDTIGNDTAIADVQFGQSFTGNGSDASRAVFYMRRTGNPTGSLTAKIYAHSGTFGTSSVATGVALAVSDPLGPNDIPTTRGLVSFTFSGANRINLANASKYVIAIDGSALAIDGSNSVQGGLDTTAPTHAGNFCYFDTTWHASATDAIFYMYGETGPTVGTLTAAPIGSSRFTSNGQVYGVGTSTVDEAGFVYSTAPLPLPGNVAPTLSGYSGYVSTVTTYPVNTAYYQRISGLETSSTYFVRAYAHNASGYSYGSEIIVSTGNLTTVSFANYDPTLMFREIIENYVSQGGHINYGVGTTDLTGLSLPYTFNTATVLEGINACLSLSPYDWYWYVDLGTNVAYFKEKLTTATHRMINGRHLSQVDIVMTIQNVKNILYFTGGDLGTGTNFFSVYRNEASIAAFGPRIGRKSDNRVVDQAAADAIGNSFINANKDESYETVIEVLDSTYDITLFKPGDTVGLYGFGNFIESLILQIVHLEYTPYSVKLTLGTLPMRATPAIEQVKRDVIALQTVANPTSPS